MTRREPRVALVGLGDAGGHHARALIAKRDRVSWSAISAHSSKGIARFRDKFPEARDLPSFTDLSALLDAKVCDAVILATPDALHVEHALQCIDAGVHVLVEKPVALTTNDARRLQAHAREKNAMVHVGYHLRHHAGHREIKARLRELVGVPLRISVEWAWPDPATAGWRATGTLARAWSLAALGTHGIDLALWLLDVDEITRHTSLLKMRGAVDAAHEATFEADEVVVHVAGSIEYRARSRVSIVGSEGELTCSGTLGARGEGEILLGRGRDEPRAILFTPHNPYAAQLDAFANAIAKSEVTDLGRAICNVQLIEEMLHHAQRT